MSKAFTGNKLVSDLIEDRTWRFKEITDLRSTIEHTKDDTQRRVLLRSLVAICYAHWEGYVKNSADKYMKFIVMHKFNLSNLQPQFTANHFLPSLLRVSSGINNINELCKIVHDITKYKSKQYKRFDGKIINTKSNLNSDVLRDICIVCGIESSFISDKHNFIDKILLKRRNEIAHGQNTFIDMGDLDYISNETLSIMREFGNAIENLIVLESYKL